MFSDKTHFFLGGNLVTERISDFISNKKYMKFPLFLYTSRKKFFIEREIRKKFITKMRAFLFRKESDQ